MGKGRAILIGLNNVDPNHYDGWDGPLNACEADAQSMSQIAVAQGLKVSLLLTRKATRANVLNALSTAAKQLGAGDYLLLTYSGHGGQVPDVNDDEDDALDETWCLFDGQLIDDELSMALAEFKQGVRVFVLSDSCHSGSVIKMALLSEHATRTLSIDSMPTRNMPNEVARRTYQLNRDFYDSLQRVTPPTRNVDVSCSALLLSGCQDNQLSADGAFNGLFTSRLLQVWNGGKFSGTYRDMYQRILSFMPPDQTPNLFWLSPEDAPFLESRPFTVGDSLDAVKRKTGIASFTKQPVGGIWKDYTGPGAKKFEITYSTSRLAELWLEQREGDKQFAQLQLSDDKATAKVPPGSYYLMFRGKTERPNEEFEIEITAPVEARWKPKPAETSDSAANVYGIEPIKIGKA